MTTARDIMSPDVTCVGENDTLEQAARLMRDLQVGAVPVCGEDRHLKGMVSDRDIVVKCLAEGGDPAQTRVGVLGEGKPVTVGADDDVQVVLETMAHHQVRRLPVVDGHDLVGIVSTADVARTLPPERVGALVSIISY
ncbi:CBS domain-containing protein [Spongisporangium articulatum]|uniref:CBS domain-containing protein n=1 Tax=Spongisporangium articulatum TaxID=3362603 RepID=A0ABW8AST5_9ACTN